MISELGVGRGPSRDCIFIPPTSVGRLWNEGWYLSVCLSIRPSVSLSRTSRCCYWAVRVYIPSSSRRFLVHFRLKRTLHVIIIMVDVSHQLHHHQASDRVFNWNWASGPAYTGQYHMLQNLCFFDLTCKLSLVWLMGGVSLLGLGDKAVRSGEEALSRPKGPKAGVGFLGAASPLASPPAIGLGKRCNLPSGV